MRSKSISKKNIEFGLRLIWYNLLGFVHSFWICHKYGLTTVQTIISKSQRQHTHTKTEITNIHIHIYFFL